LSSTIPPGPSPTLVLTDCLAELASNWMQFALFFAGRDNSPKNMITPLLRTPSTRIKVQVELRILKYSEAASMSSAGPVIISNSNHISWISHLRNKRPALLQSRGTIACMSTLGGETCRPFFGITTGFLISTSTLERASQRSLSKRLTSRGISVPHPA
jgi:hypothetical protein